MESTKYIGMDVHKDAISIAVLNSSGKLVMESIIETKANTILASIRSALPSSIRILRLKVNAASRSIAITPRQHCPTANKRERRLLLSSTGTASPRTRRCAPTC